MVAIRQRPPSGRLEYRHSTCPHSIPSHLRCIVIHIYTCLHSIPLVLYWSTYNLYTCLHSIPLVLYWSTYNYTRVSIPPSLYIYRSSGWSVGVPVRTCQTRLSSSAILAGASASPLHPSGHRPLIVWDRYPSVLPHPPSLSRMAHPPFTPSHPHTVTSSQVGLPQAVIAVCHFHCSQEGQHTHTHTHTHTHMRHLYTFTFANRLQ